MLQDIEVTKSSRWVALVVLCTGMLMIVLDQTIVNVALPSIQRELGFSQASLAWVVNAYLIAFGGLLLLAGRLGDLIGRKRIFLSGLTVFMVASALCGLSISQEWLVVGRFVQGAGGALTSAVILGMIVTMFPERGDRARAIGMYSFTASAGASIGLLLGGVLTEAINWHWIFFVNVPVGIVAAFIAVRVVEMDEGLGLGEGADVVGAILVTSALMLGVYTIVGGAELGNGPALVLGVTTLLLFGGFLIRQATAARPLLPLRIFRSRNVSGANLIQVLMVAGLFGMFFMSSLYLQRVLGYGPLQIGLAFLPAAAIIGALSYDLSGRLSMRIGPRKVLIPSLVLLVAALSLLTRAPVDGQYPRDLLPAMLLVGVGIGLAFPALMMLAMSDATPSDAGLASGLINTTAQAGGAMGLAILAAFASGRTAQQLGEGASAAAALTSGYHVAFGLSAGLVLMAIVLAVTVLQPVPVEALTSAD